MTITTSLPITLSESRTGTKKIIIFPESGKKIALKVPQGIRDGQIIKIQQQGTIYLFAITITENPTTPTQEPKEGSFLGILSRIALAIAALYTMIVLAPLPVPALLEGDTDHAWNLVKYNFTNFPPSAGPHVRCMTDDLNTPEALRLKAKAIEIGKELEKAHGYNMTERTSVSVVPSLDGPAGLAHTASNGENCIKLEINSHDMDDIIRHEWGHVAAPLNAEHGYPWRNIASKFGADTHRYRHCEDLDPLCQPTD